MRDNAGHRKVAMPKIFAIVPAAGQGTRIGDALPKQYLPLAGKPMMFHCIETLAAVLVCGIIWTLIAARRALRAPLLQALRNE